MIESSHVNPSIQCPTPAALFEMQGGQNGEFAMGTREIIDIGGVKETTQPFELPVPAHGNLPARLVLVAETDLGLQVSIPDTGRTYNTRVFNFGYILTPRVVHGEPTHYDRRLALIQHDDNSGWGEVSELAPDEEPVVIGEGQVAVSAFAEDGVRIQTQNWRSVVRTSITRIDVPADPTPQQPSVRPDTSTPVRQVVLPDGRLVDYNLGSHYPHGTQKYGHD